MKGHGTLQIITRNENEFAMVEIADSGPHPVHAHIGQPGFCRHIGECTVSVIVIELKRRLPVLGMAREVLSVENQDIRKPIVVVIDKRAARTQRFG